MTQQPYTFNLDAMTAKDFALIAEASKRGSLLAILVLAGKYTETDIDTLPFSELNTFMDCFGAALAEWHDKRQIEQAFTALRGKGHGHLH